MSSLIAPILGLWLCGAASPGDAARAATEPAMVAYANAVADVSEARGTFVWSARDLFGSNALRERTGLDRIVDGWGTDLEAELIVLVESFGADGALGGNDDAADLRVASIAGEASGDLSRTAIPIREPTVTQTHCHEHPVFGFLCGKRDSTVERMTMLASQIGRWSSRSGRLPTTLAELGAVESGGFPIARFDAWDRPLRMRYALRVRSLGADRKLYGLDRAADLAAMFAVRDERGRWLHGDEIEVLEPMRPLRGVNVELPAEWHGLAFALGRDGRVVRRAELMPPAASPLPWTLRFDDVAEDDLTLFASEDAESNDPDEWFPIAVVAPRDGMIVTPRPFGQAVQQPFRVVDESSGAPWVGVQVTASLVVGSRTFASASAITDENGSCSLVLSSVGTQRICVGSETGGKLIERSFTRGATSATVTLVVGESRR